MIFNKQFSLKSVVQILVCPLCAIFPVQRLTSIIRTAYKEDHDEAEHHFTNLYLMKNEQPGVSVTQLPYTCVVSWSISPAFLTMPRYHMCKVSQDLREQKGHMCTGCPAPDLSCSLLSCNQVVESGSNFCWHYFIKS